jgi:hypothetical protein
MSDAYCSNEENEARISDADVASNDASDTSDSDNVSESASVGSETLDTLESLNAQADYLDERDEKSASADDVLLLPASEDGLAPTKLAAPIDGLCIRRAAADSDTYIICCSGANSLALVRRVQWVACW